MAYTGGTTMVSPRLKAIHLVWLEAYTAKPNKVINEALSAFLHKVQCDKLDPTERDSICRHGRDPYDFPPALRRKKTLRIMRQNCEYIRLNCLNMTRCLDFALEDYIHANRHKAQLPNSQTTTDL